ncbi:phosphoenolpyruvate-utilizing N-terminal domain-containing protein, partial [Streptococcus massiliensis]
MTEMLKGIAASDGVAVAKAYLLVQPDLSFETVSVEDTSAEEARLDVALEASQNELSLIREKAVDSLGEEAAQVFDAHLMVLADPEMIGQIKETIRNKKVNAEAGLKEVTDMFITIFENMEDNPYMQERAADIRDVTKRVLRFFGIGESQLVTILADLIDKQTDPTIAPYAKTGEVTLRL